VILTGLVNAPSMPPKHLYCFHRVNTASATAL
jgi:hypothetical protein